MQYDEAFHRECSGVQVWAIHENNPELEHIEIHLPESVGITVSTNDDRPRIVLRMSPDQWQELILHAQNPLRS